MFRPPAFRVDDDEAFTLIERSAFGHLVAHDGDGFSATSLPLLLDRERHVLRGHLARANRQWKRLDGSDVFVLFQLTDGYVTPSWYPSKAEHGKVVPTWNYEVVQVHGVARVHDDVEWLRSIVTDLTDHHEARHPERDVAGPAWQVTDAPDEFVDKMLLAIVGVEVDITSVEAARKLSQNRPDPDRAGVVAGLEASADPVDRALGRAVRSTVE